VHSLTCLLTPLQPAGGGRANAEEQAEQQARCDLHVHGWLIAVKHGRNAHECIGVHSEYRSARTAYANQPYCARLTWRCAVNRISIVKPDRARAVEELIIRMARSGQIRGKVTEQQLIELLEGIKESEVTEPKIVVRRLIANRVLIRAD
jgi:hypothetical protein